MLFLVEDNMPFAALMSHQLKELVQVSVYNNAEKALSALIHGARPALVLTDLNLPGINGVQLANVVLEAFEEVNIALLSSEADVVQQFLETHANNNAVNNCPAFQKTRQDIELIKTWVKTLL